MHTHHVFIHSSDDGHSGCFCVFATVNSDAVDTGGFPGGSDGEASACSVGDPGSIPALERSPGEGNGTPLQNSCLENSMDGGAY